MKSRLEWWIVSHGDVRDHPWAKADDQVWDLMCDAADHALPFRRYPDSFFVTTEPGV